MANIVGVGPVPVGADVSVVNNESDWGVISLLKSAGNTVYDVVASVFTAIGNFFSSIAEWIGCSEAPKRTVEVIEQGAALTEAPVTTEAVKNTVEPAASNPTAVGARPETSSEEFFSIGFF